ncbi:MAG: hypothetical protein AAGK04_04330 [Planctomycetota bacterium]
MRWNLVAATALVATTLAATGSPAMAQSFDAEEWAFLREQSVRYGELMAEMQELQDDLGRSMQRQNSMMHAPPGYSHADDARHKVEMLESRRAGMDESAPMWESLAEAIEHPDDTVALQRLTAWLEHHKAMVGSEQEAYQAKSSSMRAIRDFAERQIAQRELRVMGARINELEMPVRIAESAAGLGVHSLRWNLQQTFEEHLPKERRQIDQDLAWQERRLKIAEGGPAVAAEERQRAQAAVQETMTKTGDLQKKVQSAARRADNLMPGHAAAASQVFQDTFNKVLLRRNGGMTPGGRVSMMTDMMSGSQLLIAGEPMRYTIKLQEHGAELPFFAQPIEGTNASFARGKPRGPACLVYTGRYVIEVTPENKHSPSPIPADEIAHAVAACVDLATLAKM